MMITQSVYLNGEFLFSLARPYAELSPWGGYFVSSSKAYICPVCLKTWAVLPVEGVDVFQVQGAPCERHPLEELSIHPVAGSLIPAWGLDSIDETFIDAMPQKWLRREFELHMNWRLRDDNSNGTG